MYDFKRIDEKWQNYWEDNGYYMVSNDFSKKKQYNLVEFPYPSGVGMHLGHIKAYLGMEVLSRRQRMQGLNVLFPMGFDAFGLPAENYAMQVGKHPRIITDENIKVFTNQLKRVGFSFNYERIVDTTDPKYYKWTQWIFLKLFENGLAYRDRTYVNYCPDCKVVLSNEDSQGGECDRCGTEVIQKEKDVWFLKITEYAEKLLEGLDTIDFPARVRLGQENWIGKSIGAYVDFKVKGLDEVLKVYTTRVDTLYGVTFMVIAPEHPMIEENKNIISNYEELVEYKLKANKKTEFERTQINKDKTGVIIEGISAINPVNNKEIPIYVADYVMMGYGTGAIMAVPAHDDRDFEFAVKYNIPITQVIQKVTGKKLDNEQTKNSIVALVFDPKTNKYLTLNWENKGGRLLVGGTINDNEDALTCAIREIKEETGYVDLKHLKTGFKINHHYFAHNKACAFEIVATPIYFELLSDKQEKQQMDEDEVNNFKTEWVSESVIQKEVLDELHKAVFDEANSLAYSGDGIHINSGILDGLNKEDAIHKMIEFLKEKNIGEYAVQYKMKDWAFNRQRYWGEPIPIVHCATCGMVAVPYDELPLKLPELQDFEPGPDGESPLANIETWVNCKCPKCGNDARRETDTMPQWAGSSWYYLRYCDPFNEEEICSKEAMEYWMSVDVYNGGTEHISRHLIYSRFWHRFLYDIGIVNTPEPYKKRTTQGLILGSDNLKMSKSKGNTIDPLSVVNEYGADVLRTYILFMGDYGEDSPWNDQGVKGVNRFLDRVYRLQDIVTDSNEYTKEFESTIQKTIKKVTEDIDNLKYNTAIAEMMKLINLYYDKGSISKKDYEVLITLLYPFAPHVCEEINELLGNVSLTKQNWPVYDEAKIIDDFVTMAVSVNGKHRANIEVPKDAEQSLVLEKAKMSDNVVKYIEGKDIVKEIVVPNRIVNIVVK